MSSLFARSSWSLEVFGLDILGWSHESKSCWHLFLQSISHLSENQAYGQLWCQERCQSVKVSKGQVKSFAPVHYEKWALQMLVRPACLGNLALASQGHSSALENPLRSLCRSWRPSKDRHYRAIGILVSILEQKGIHTLTLEANWPSRALLDKTWCLELDQRSNSRYWLCPYFPFLNKPVEVSWEPWLRHV